MGGAEAIMEAEGGRGRERGGERGEREKRGGGKEG